MSAIWKAPPLQDKRVDLFIGILSAGNHFAECMAIRKSWMQNRLSKSSKVVARFFVALHPRKEVNVELKREAEFFGDIVIVPYVDHYDLVVLKTVAICEYGVRTAAAKYIMKCDGDTFVRVEAVLKESNKTPENRSFYIGNINYYHKPLRSGKWVVMYKVWPEEFYPPYAYGPGYIISSDIANFIVSDFEKQKLRAYILSFPICMNALLLFASVNLFVKLAPPVTFPRAEGKIKPISLPEDVYIKKFFKKYPESKYQDPIKLVSERTGFGVLRSKDEAKLFVFLYVDVVVTVQAGHCLMICGE